jgi:hypothetical protein
MKVVEIRVPGVGGATAEEMLGERPFQVQGDDSAGFYVGAADVDAEAPALEVYEWGRLTSGPSASAGWWILLPFTLLNVSGWMFPAGRPTDTDHGTVWDRGPGRARPWVSGMWWTRLVVVIGGGLLSMLYLLWMAVIFVGVVAVGCGGDAVSGCASRGPLKLLTLQGGTGTWRVGLGLACTMLVWFLLLWYVQRSHGLEGFEPDEAERSTSARHLVEELEKRTSRRVVDERTAPGSRLSRNTQLDDRAFWYRWTEYRRLWRWHLLVSAVTLGVVAGVSLHVVRPARWAPGGDPILLTAVIVAAVAALGFSMASGIERRPDTIVPAPPRPFWWAVMWGVGYTIVGGLVAWWASAGVIPTMSDATQVGTGLVNGVRFVSALMILLALLLAFVQWGRMEWPQVPPLRSLFPLVVAGFAVMVAGAGWGSLNVVVGRALLGPEAFAALDADTTFPEVIVVALVLGVIIWLVPNWWRREPVGPIVAQYFHAPPGDDAGGSLSKVAPALSDRDRRWVRRIRRRRRMSEWGGHGDALFGLVAIIGLVILGMELFRLGVVPPTGGSAGGTSAGRCNFMGLVDGITPDDRGLFGCPALRALHPWSAWLLVTFVFPGVWIMRQAFGARSNRRTFAKVWDVLSFWPRRFHPFGAPSYAERAVPELRDRIKHHVSRGHGVVLATHSQGTVIGYATLIGLKGAEDRRRRRRAEPRATHRAGPPADVVQIRKILAGDIPEQRRYRAAADLGPKTEFALGTRVNFVTYGSPLSQLYGRFFPGHFGIDGSFQGLRDALAPVSGTPGWRSFYRPTDYIGKRVFIAPGGLIDGSPGSGGPPSRGCGPQAAPAGYPADTWLCEAREKLAPIESHSNYEYERLLREWLERVRRSMRSRR